MLHFLDTEMNSFPISVTTLLFSFTIFWKLIDGSYIGDVAINCGYRGKTTALDGRQWFGDMDSSSGISVLQPRGHSRSSIPHQKSLFADPIPYMTARTSATQFYYSFQVNPGQKFMRLHFYPSASYQGFENSLDFFTVKAGPFTLLRNFSASLAADAVGVNYIIKEFCVNVEENEILNLTFTPAQSAKGKNYHAFVNGIEIITMPTGLYFTPDDDLGALVVGQSNRYFHIDNSTALETVQRLNIGGGSIYPVEDFGMFRRWNADSNYLLGSELQPVNHLVSWTNTGLYKFSAPPRIFHTSWQTAKNGRTDNAYYNFTWKIPVDLGFGYLVRLHFCDFALVEREVKGVKVNVLIDNQVAETVIDVIRLSGRNGVPIYRDYMVMIKGDEVDRYDLFVALQSSDELAIQLLRGLEIFKLSNPDNNLASKNEVYLKQVSAAPWNLKTKHFLSAFDKKNTIVTGITILLILLNFIVSKLRQNWEESTCHEEEDSQSASRKLSCRKFSLAEIILATQNFSNAFLIGKGGFGYVYKGLIRGGSKTVAIKRLKSNSKQGAREFWTEIETLSSIRHKHLVPLIGYCNEYREMILVYKYMPGGTLADNLYGIGRNGEDATYLTWEQRLSICIAAARGLDYLHTGIEYEIIHRDVKDSNILLDKNFVAKISDFGLSKLRNVSESQGNLTTKVKGTPGFVDPDYFMTHKPTTKTDVYAFGVVMLVVLCGRPAIDRSIPWEPRSLLSFFQEHTRKGDVNGIVDPSMRGKISTQSMNEFIKSLENCLHIEPRERPTMSEVATSLEWALEMQQSTMSCNPKQVVRFRSLEKPKEDEFCLELSKQNNYYEVVESVARHLSVDDPSKIRLTSHNCYSQQPKPQPIKYRSVEHLSDMLVHDNQTSDILYYETLDVPLPELQGLKSLKVVFHHATKDEIITHTIRLPKQSTVGDVLADLKTKVELSHPNAELRLLEIFYHKIYKIFPLKEEIENVNDQYWTLRAEEIPEEEKNLGPHDRLIHVYHFMKDTTQNRVQVQNFGEPFHLVIRERETLAEVKLRIQKKLLVPDKEFSKWKFAFVTLGRPKYLQDSDIVSSRFQRRDVYGAWEQYLGLEHSDNAPKSSYATNQN